MNSHGLVRTSITFVMMKKVMVLSILLLMILVPAILLVLPASSFDSGPPLCIYTIIAGVKCPGCGLTRGVMHLLHFDISGAWEFNKLTFVVFPVLSFYYVRYFIRKFKEFKSINSSTTINNQN